MREWIARWWLDAIMGGIVAALGIGYRRLRAKTKKDETELAAIRAAVTSSLRDRIVQAYYYHMGKGYMPIHSRDSVADLYKQYTALGGNGTISTLMERLNALPTDERKGDTK